MNDEIKRKIKKRAITVSLENTEGIRRFLVESKGLSVEAAHKSTLHYYKTFKHGFVAVAEYVLELMGERL